MSCRADTNINSLRLSPSWINISWSALQQHVFISDNSQVRKNYFLIKQSQNQSLKLFTEEAGKFGRYGNFRQDDTKCTAVPGFTRRRTCYITTPYPAKKNERRTSKPQKTFEGKIMGE